MLYYVMGQSGISYTYSYGLKDSVRDVRTLKMIQGHEMVARNCQMTQKVMGDQLYINSSRLVR
jgi:hypothetical protein